MADNRYIRSARAAISERTGEEVLGAAFVARAGAMGAFVGGQALRGLGAAAGGDGLTLARAPSSKVRGEHGQDAKLPTSFLVAVTPDRLHLFKYRNGYFKTRVRGHLGSLARPGVQLETAETSLTTQFHLQSEAQELRFEMNHHAVTREFASLLARWAGS